MNRIIKNISTKTPDIIAYPGKNIGKSTKVNQLRNLMCGLEQKFNY